MRARIAIALTVVVGCKKEAPRYDGPLRVEFGDCAVDPAWVSGPRPLPIVDKVAAKEPEKPKKPDEPKTLTADERKQAIEQARTAGLLGENGGAFASLTGTGDISSGFDDENIYGGLLGNEAGEMNGGFGYGRSGFGPGGGGTGWGTIGTGRYGSIGHGSGTGTGYGVGGGRGGMRGRTANVPTVSIGQPNAQGDLDKAIIRRYIKRNIQKIQYCYEKQLLADPKLGGTVAAQFFIDPEGHVASATASGMHPDVASCVAGVIKAIEFPKPKGGGGVQVNYPFTFRPADDTAGTPAPARATAAVGDGDGDLGPFTLDEINRVVRSRAGIYRACYQKELAKQPGIGGKVVVKLEIGADGKVVSAASTGATTMKSDGVTTCVVTNIQRLVFPAKGGKATVTYPFIFSAGGDSTAVEDKPLDPPPQKELLPTKAATATAAYKPGANNPLVAQSAAIEECLRRDAKHYGAVVVALDPVAPKVDGVSDSVAECIADVAKAVTPPKPNMRCSLAFGTMPIEELPSVEITATVINLDGTQVDTVAWVLKDDSPSMKIDSLFTKLDNLNKAQAKATGPVAIEGPRVLRAASATPIQVVNKVLHSMVAAGSDFALATDSHDGVWKLIDPWMFPAVPVPRGSGGTWNRQRPRKHGALSVDDESVKLSLLIDKDQIWVGLSRVNEFTPVPRGPQGYDWEKLETILKQQKASAFFADRTDFEIAGENGTYGDLIRAIEVAHAVGFIDHEVTDPTGLAARPTL